VVDNDGLHGARRRCGTIKLQTGLRKLFVPGFQRYGGAFMSATYRGPDTGNVLRYLRSDNQNAPKKPAASQWTLRMFKGRRLRSMADAMWQWLDYVGEKKVLRVCLCSRSRSRSLTRRRGARRRLALYACLCLCLCLCALVRALRRHVWKRARVGVGSDAVPAHAQVRDVYIRNNQDFIRKIKGTPSHDYAWIYYGTVAITRQGTYTFCSTSDDGSFLFVDGVKIVNNDGLHGARRKCGSTKLTSGNHKVEVKGFQHHGGAYQRATYSGPDTNGRNRRMVSLPTKGPSLPGPSQWEMRMYKTSYSPFQVVPDVSHMTYVGRATISNIYFSRLSHLRRWIPKTPSVRYAWQIYGKVVVRRRGTYTFCSTSDDGSFVYVKNKKVVDNDGLHGRVEKCGSIKLGAGHWPVVLIGFQNGGGVYQSFRYKGPDTMNTYKDVRSSDSGAPQSTKGTAGQYGRWPPEMPYTPGPGPWPKGYCNLMNAQCTALGIKDNLCGTCTALAGGGVKLSNVRGLRFNGASFDDNQNGKGTYQAQNICMLAKYGNKGKIDFYAKPSSYGVTGGGVPGQVHWFGNCRKGYKACILKSPLYSASI